jgi:hypothetical protein
MIMLGRGAPARRRCGLPDPVLITDPGPSRSARVRARWVLLPGNLRGGIWFLAGAAILTVMLTLIKLAGQSLHVTEILFFRQLTMVAVSLPAILHGFPGSLKSQRVDLQLLRIGVAFGAMMLGFTAVIHLPLAEVTQGAALGGPGSGIRRGADHPVAHRRERLQHLWAGLDRQRLSGGGGNGADPQAEPGR